jgi:hypothetical protein
VSSAEREPQGDREGWHESEPNPTQQRIDEEPPEEREKLVGVPDVPEKDDG